MEEFGPAAGEVQQLVTDRTLSLTDRVRSEGSLNWITVSEFLVVIVPGNSGLTNAGMSQGNDERQFGLDLDSFNLQADLDRDFDDRSSGLNINSFNLHVESVALQPVVSKQLSESIRELVLT
jgi:hypothetical protein